MKQELYIIQARLYTVDLLPLTDLHKADILDDKKNIHLAHLLGIG